LQLTEKGKAVLFKKEQVYLTAPVEIEIAKDPVIFQPHPYEKQLFDNLKKLRNQIAQQENVPPYIIFSDSTLLDLATYLPLTPGDLLKIPGFGTYKTEKYGHAFLEEVQNYCLQNKFETRILLKQLKRERKQKTPASERPSDTKQVTFSLYKEGKSISQIAEERALSVSTIESHLSYYISTGDLLLDDCVSRHTQQAVKDAVSVHGQNSLKVLKDNLPEQVSYGEIRMVLASITSREEK
jgi:ATP-dependent DNA helicase RecQ